MPRLPLCLLVAAVALAAPAFAAEDASEIVLDFVPPPVAEATWCAADGPEFATRRVFAGHVIFAVECPGNNQNFVEALVAADDENGANARAIVFPTPYPPDPDSPNNSLSNIRWLDGGEVAELFVSDPDLPGACRHEARWRLAGGRPDATLRFWRETDDCDGAAGWTVIVGTE